MTPDQIADFKKRYLDKFKDAVSVEHKGFKEIKCLILGDAESKSKTVEGYDIFKITNADGTTKEERVC